jgi:phasin family protein
MGGHGTNPFFYKEFGMVQVTEQVAAFGKSQLDAVLKLAEAAAENIEKLTDVQLKAAKAAYDDGVKAFKQLAAVKDANELASISTAAAHPAWDKSTAYAKNVYDVLASAQAEFASLLEEQVAEMNKNMVVTLDAALKAAPAGSESVIAALKSAIQSANTVYETLVKAAKQLASATEANVAAVAQAAPARKKAA